MKLTWWFFDRYTENIAHSHKSCLVAMSPILTTIWPKSALFFILKLFVLSLKKCYSAYLHVSWFQMPINQQFYHVSSAPFSFPDAFLPWSASVCKSLITMQYSSDVKEQGKVGVVAGGRMVRAWAQRSTTAMTAVSTYLRQQPSCLHKNSSTCGSNLWFINISG